MVRSLVLPRFFAACSLVAVFTFSARTSRAQEISAEPADTQSSANSSTPASSTHETPDPADLEVSWRKMPARFLHDEKDMWLFPTKLGKAKN
jgi:hypothetical protein